jgi:hypothetical protein
VGSFYCLNSRTHHNAMSTEEIEVKGFAVIPNVLDSATVAFFVDQLGRIPLSNAIKRRGQNYFGIRNLLNVVPAVRELALRFHLDDTEEESGVLRVIPGSHKHGRLSAVEIERIKRETRAVKCSVKKGDVLAMRPLLLHSSSSANATSHRRVIHLEFSSMELPGGLEWYLS